MQDKEDPLKASQYMKLNTDLKDFEKLTNQQRYFENGEELK